MHYHINMYMPVIDAIMDLLQYVYHSYMYIYIYIFHGNLITFYPSQCRSHHHVSHIRHHISLYCFYVVRDLLWRLWRIRKSRWVWWIQYWIQHWIQ